VRKEERLSASALSETRGKEEKELFILCRGRGVKEKKTRGRMG